MSLYKKFGKRTLDIVISGTALFALSIPLLIITLWLYFANKGAGAFFFQERPGKDCKIFRIYKFKSMTDEKDSNGDLLPDADRITPIGKFIRATSIDELPQLWNVLKGDMSLIGPRPLLIKFLPYYTEREQLRHTVLPGITGLAQIRGRNHVTWDQKLENDAIYVENLSFSLDAKIFWKSIIAVLQHEDIEVVNPESDLDDERRDKNVV